MWKQRTSKYCVLLLMLSLCYILSACGKSEEVISLEEQITNIGAVDENSLTSIEAAESLYSSLEDKDRKNVENYADLQAARAEYDNLMASGVIELIDQIGAVNEESPDKISAAEDAFARLTDNQKMLVSNSDILETARNTYTVLLVGNVENLIATIQYDGGEPTPELLSSIRVAQDAYGKLSTELRPQVKNYPDLEATVEAISQYSVQKVQEAIDLAIDTDAGYEEAEKLYNTLTAEQKTKVGNYSTFKENYEAYKNKPPIELVSYQLKKSITGEPEFYLKATNVSDDIVKEFSIMVFAYDGDGVPVSLYFGDYAKALAYTTAVKVGESTSSNRYWQLYGTYSDMKQFVVILTSVEFFDGTTWENSQAGTLYAKYEQQLLASDDKNILPRG